MIGASARVGVAGWAGTHWYAVRIVGETAQRWRVVCDETMRLPSRRIVEPGRPVLLPKRVVVLTPCENR